MNTINISWVYTFSGKYIFMMYNSMLLALLYRTVLIVVVIIAPITIQAQNAQIDYFEFNVGYTMDSTQHNIYYVLAISGSEQVSNVSIVVNNQEGHSVAALSASIAELKSDHAYRVENNVLYLTIETGTHALSAYYEAKAILIPISGTPLEYTRTKQM